MEKSVNKMYKNMNKWMDGCWNEQREKERKKNGWKERKKEITKNLFSL